MTVTHEELKQTRFAPTGTMRAFVLNGLEHVSFAEKSVSTPGPTDAVIKTTRALICTSDSHTFPFDELDVAFQMMDKKLDGIIKPLICSESPSGDKRAAG